MILDTNALSAFADGEPDAVAEIGKAPQIAIPVIVMGEFLFGIAQSRRRAEYEGWINRILDTSQFLEFGAVTASAYAELRLELKHSGTPIPSNDMWIAALCRQHSLSILSKDQHFDRVKGVRRIGW